jgi:hypothetical protein
MVALRVMRKFLKRSSLATGNSNMKTTFVVLFTLCAVSAFGQSVSGSLSSQVSVFQIPDHPQHAYMHEMGVEQSLVGGGSYTYAQGERPLWEFGEVSHQTPLGDIARAYRKEKQTAKKAEIVFEKQGS